MQEYLIVEDIIAQAVVLGSDLLRAAQDAVSEGPSDSSGTFRLNPDLDAGSDAALAEVLLQDEVDVVIAASRQSEVLVPMLARLLCPLTLRRKAEASAARLLTAVEELGLLRQAGAVAPLAPEPVTDDLFTFAQRCATEHCVLGTYRAARLSIVAGFTEDAELGSAWSRLADDLRAQAVLAWELLDWAQSQLSPSRTRVIRDEQNQAFELLDDLLESEGGALARVLDRSGRSVAKGLLDDLRSGLLTGEAGRKTKAS